MSATKETLLLDPSNFNSNARKWNVPLLNLPGVRASSLIRHRQKYNYTLS